jgi:glucose/arabinose dehydrogenase
MKLIVWLLLFLMYLFMPLVPVSAQVPAVPVGSNYTWVEVVSGFDNPLLVTHAGDGSGRLFVGEQTGFILIVQDGDYLFDPFLDISGLLSNDVFQGGYSERGLLGLAFHPDYANNGYFFVSHTDERGDNRIVRYQVSADDPNRADPATRTEFLHIPQPHYDHNGGNIAFGTDGYLYIGIGDGGSLGDDPGMYAQNTSSLLGKLLRIDVNTPDGDRPYSIPADNPFVSTDGALPEIWAIGLRNPWRFSFDRATGDLYIGDVGQELFEEINVQSAGTPGGANYGWYWYEANQPHRTLPPNPPEITLPVTEYPHIVGCSVTGGYVYRGAALPELNGVYLFGDYCTGRTWSLLRDESGAWRVQPFIHTGHIISAFGEDEAGELYLVDYKGALLRLERAS